IATYSKMDGITVLGKNNIYMSQSGLNVSAITFHAVTLKDEGCYNCIFNTFPLGSIPGRTCLKVYVNVRRLPDPDNAGEEILDISCFVTGRPTPTITWKVTENLQIKPKEYIIHHPNQTATVISNFTHSASRNVGNSTIICVIHHPSLNTTRELTLPCTACPLQSSLPEYCIALLLISVSQTASIPWLFYPFPGGLYS
uniref:Ig-like domain-containing protein n=1 Tax=Salvator merianae TaxID=96440 RepID=A0A8D0B773_SALMN